MFFRSGSTTFSCPDPPSLTQHLTGLCFQPKAVMIFDAGGYEGYGDAAPTTGNLFGHFLGRHAATSTGQIVQGSRWKRWDSDNNETLTYSKISGAATFNSFDADGFTLTFDALGDYQRYWMAFGGDNLEAYSGYYTVPTSTGDFSVTGVGFQPDFLFAISGKDEDDLSGSICIGMADANLNQVSSSFARGITISPGERRAFDDRYLMNQIGANGHKSALVSMDSDGFTVNMSANTGAGSYSYVFYLALKDPTESFKVGTETQKTSTGTKATTGAGFQPGGGIFFPSRSTSSQDYTAPYSNAVWGMGAADGAGNQEVFELFFDASYPGQNKREVDGSALSMSALNATTLAEAQVSSWDADGFTLNWSTSDSTARYFGYGVFSTEFADPCQRGYTPQIYRYG